MLPESKMSVNTLPPLPPSPSHRREAADIESPALRLCMEDPYTSLLPSGMTPLLSNLPPTQLFSKLVSSFTYMLHLPDHLIASSTPVQPITNCEQDSMDAETEGFAGDSESDSDDSVDSVRALDKSGFDIDETGEEETSSRPQSRRQITFKDEDPMMGQGSIASTLTQGEPVVLEWNGTC